MIAYSSVAHMGFVTIGIFTLTQDGMNGAYFQMISHGIVSAALFLIVGVVYERHHTRLINRYGGLVLIMPKYAIVFMVFTLGSLGLPGTSGFVGEFLILVGAFQANTTIAVLGATGMVLGGGYSLWLFNRIAYGNLKVQALKAFSDMNRREFAIQLPLILGTFVMGIYPEIFLDPMHVVL